MDAQDVQVEFDDILKYIDVAKYPYVVLHVPSVGKPEFWTFEVGRLAAKRRVEKETAGYDDPENWTFKAFELNRSVTRMTVNNVSREFVQVTIGEEMK